MALRPVRRGGSLSRPGSQAPVRRDPLAGSGDPYQRMGQLMSGASGGGWQPMGQSRAPLAGLSETGDAYLAGAGLPGVARHDISAGRAARDRSAAGGSRDSAPDRAGRALRRGRRPGRFGYRVLLPGQAEADKVTAARAGGVLAVTVPRSQAGRPRRIQVTAG